MADSSQAEESKTDKKELSASMNPLKSHYGIDLGLPKPILYVVNFILVIFVTTTRLVLYGLVGLIGAIISYVITFGAYCPLFANDIFGCYATQYDSPLMIGAAVVGAVIFIIIAHLIDSHVNWKKQF